VNVFFIRDLWDELVDKQKKEMQKWIENLYIDCQKNKWNK